MKPPHDTDWNGTTVCKVFSLHVKVLILSLDKNLVETETRKE